MPIIIFSPNFLNRIIEGLSILLILTKTQFCIILTFDFYWYDILNHYFFSNLLILANNFFTFCLFVQHWGICLLAQAPVSHYLNREGSLWQGFWVSHALRLEAFPHNFSKVFACGSIRVICLHCNWHMISACGLDLE